MESIEKILKAVLDAHAGDPQLLALQLKASPASVQRWLAGEAKPRPAYEAKLRQFFSELAHKPPALHETAPSYRVTPHHPMITEAVDQTLRSIREILHKRGRLSSRSQALDELSKLLFAHVQAMRLAERRHLPANTFPLPNKRRRLGRGPQDLCGRNRPPQPA